MDVCIGRYFAKGDALHPGTELDQTLFIKGYSVYEVIRVIDRICLFLKEHLDRLAESVHLSNLNYTIDYDFFSHTISKLISKNKRTIGNIKLVVHFPESGNPVPFIYFIPYQYPSAYQYKHGVFTSLLNSVRLDPNIKKVIPPMPIIKSDSKANIFENLFVDKHGNITEGSKSNIFFLKQSTVYTAPDKLVLKGITRQKVHTILKKLNYNVIYKPITINDLTEMESVFLTGTSPKVIPVRYIDNWRFNVNNPLLRQVMKKYNEMVDVYLKETRLKI